MIGCRGGQNGGGGGVPYVAQVTLTSRKTLKCLLTSPEKNCKKIFFTDVKRSNY